MNRSLFAFNFQLITNDRTGEPLSCDALALSLVAVSGELERSVLQVLDSFFCFNTSTLKVRLCFNVGAASPSGVAVIEPPHTTQRR